MGSAMHITRRNSTITNVNRCCPSNGAKWDRECAWFDLDGDGHEDLVIGAGRGGVRDSIGMMAAVNSSLGRRIKPCRAQ